MVRTPARIAALMPSAPAAGFLDRDGQLFVGVLLRSRRQAAGKHRAGGENLREVGAVLVVGADCGAHRIDPVRQVPHDGHVHVDRELARVARAARGRDVVAGDLHARPGDGALVDDVAEIHIGVGPGRAHVADGREAGAQGGERVRRSPERRLRGGGGGQDLLPVRAHLVGEVGVEVDHAGQKRRVAEVDDDIAPSCELLAAHGHNAVAFDDQQSRFGKLTAAVNEARGADQDRGVLGRIILGRHARRKRGDRRSRCLAHRECGEDGRAHPQPECLQAGIVTLDRTQL